MDFRKGTDGFAELRQREPCSHAFHVRMEVSPEGLRLVETRFAHRRCDRGHRRPILLAANLLAAVVAGGLIFAAWSSDVEPRRVNISILVAGGVIGWTVGILLTPVTPTEGVQ